MAFEWVRDRVERWRERDSRSPRVQQADFSCAPPVRPSPLWALGRLLVARTRASGVSIFDRTEMGWEMRGTRGGLTTRDYWNWLTPWIVLFRVEEWGSCREAREGFDLVDVDCG